ncbi:MAG: hypothetical protein ACTSRD_03085 [Promethearchaeota archaeon]
MGRNTRWYKFQRGMDKLKKWFRKVRYGKIGANKGIESQRGSVDGFINEVVSRKQNQGI